MKRQGLLLGIWKRTVLAVALAVLFLLATVVYYRAALPSSFYVRAGQELNISAALPVALQREKGAATDRKDAVCRTGKLCLFGLIPIKEARVTSLSETKVLPGGEPFGMKLFSSGIMVSSFRDIKKADGGAACPGRESGLQPGDLLLSANGVPLTENEDLIHAVQSSGEKKLVLSGERNGTARQFTVTPVLGADRVYRIGVLIKDSSAGIGTITFYEPVSGCFGGLGHPICDADSGAPIPLGQGEAVPAQIESVVKGTAGEAGELRGSFSSLVPLGKLTANTDCGIFGRYEKKLPGKTPVPVAMAQEVKKGPAVIYTTISGGHPKAYEIEIEAVRLDEKAGTRNLTIHVTDKALLAKTGGILQGMSGSPILQRGALVGAVTHVLIGDPTRGYGVFADTMLRTLRQNTPFGSTAAAFTYFLFPAPCRWRGGGQSAPEWCPLR